MNILISNKESEYMTSAYKLLYEIETTLKYTVHKIYYKKYGFDWERKLNAKKSLDKYTYPQVLSLFYLNHLQGCFEVPQLELLHKLCPIRNDIAHMRPITQTEYQLLLSCHFFITEKVRRENQLLLHSIEQP
ncbi:hypothetical protein [Evansella tamaricis]|uniref:Swt1-like HEPN domain-containing protein n=1 Tax=Evansella tamaricis TaxID=2069301 RepID=A0ABS6JHR0_9BACI|nr:hypothetical protein [Evansella tamaricis]MBU9713207.1 hypothetical protein [Evansella tamaricis]